MNVRFFLNSHRQLEAEIDRDREVMIAPHFSQNDNMDKAAEYLRGVAAKMTELYGAGEVEAAGNLLEEAETKIQKAQTAERFMDEISF